MLSPWHWRSQSLSHRTGSDIFAALFLEQDIATLLESPYPASPDYPQLGRFSIGAGVARSNCLWSPELGEILPFLQTLIQKETDRTTPADVPDHLPFIGGWLGWLGYDLAWEIERLPYLNSDPLPFPVAYWYEPECFAVLDHEQQVLWLAATEIDQLDAMEARLIDAPSNPFTPANGSIDPIEPTFQLSQADYEAIVQQAQKHIQAGDIFQANLSLRFEVETTADPWRIYQALHHINPSPFASYWKTPWGTMMSCSPERLVQCRDRIAQTRPIAGTRPRGTTLEHDRDLSEELLNNTKEQAEHIMLVDLERNDLGRVCEWGSVEVDELLVIERYSHVMHLVSNVRGQLRSHIDPIELIRALFPGGTITGCPKVRCMEIIETLEPVRRSLFYGSCGYLDRRGYLDLNILIRTLLASNDSPRKIWGQVGAGIVADSDPEREWKESLHKAQAQLKALSIATNHPHVNSIVANNV